MPADARPQEDLKSETSFLSREVIPFAQFSVGRVGESISEGVRRSAAALVRDALEPTAEPLLRIRVRGALLPGEAADERLIDLPRIPRYLLEF